MCPHKCVNHVSNGLVENQERTLLKLQKQNIELQNMDAWWNWKIRVETIIGWGNLSGEIVQS